VEQITEALSQPAFSLTLVWLAFAFVVWSWRHQKQAHEELQGQLQELHGEVRQQREMVVPTSEVREVHINGSLMREGADYDWVDGNLQMDFQLKASDAIAVTYHRGALGSEVRYLDITESVAPGSPVRLGDAPVVTPQPAPPPPDPRPLAPTRFERILDDD